MQSKTQYTLLNDVSADIFRAYDIRGVVGKELTPDVVYTIGAAIGNVILERGSKTVAVGRDGRLSGPELLTALAAGLSASGCNVINIGAVPTPLLYYATWESAADSGVMLTGSHNPPDYNGIKMVVGREALWGKDIEKLYARIKNGQVKIAAIPGQEKVADLIPAYLKRITSDVKLKRPLKVVIDCGNGIGGVIAPELFKQLGCEVIPLFCDVDGHFPNHHPDPSVAKNLQDVIATVKKENADLGLAFDGDGDRVGVVTDQGDIIFADRLLMYFALALLENNPNAIVIYDVKCTRNLAVQIRKHGGRPLMVATGHSILKAKMKEVGALLAGELSGHMFFKERWYGFDDGIYAGARLVELISKETQSISAVFKALPDSINTPEVKIPIDEANKFVFMQRLVKETKIVGAEINTTDGLRADFADGFGLIRASNTTPYLVGRFEADSEEALKRILGIFREKLLALDSTLKVPF